MDSNSSLGGEEINKDFKRDEITKTRYKTLKRIGKSLTCILRVFINYGPCKIHREFIQKAKKLQEVPDRKGEVAVITGGGRGIGLQVVKKLIQSNFTVIIGVRNVTACRMALNEMQIKDESNEVNDSAVILQLDLKSLKSVRQFASNVLQRTNRIDLLINNAGIMFNPHEVTEDGYESHFQVNYLGHFLLTNLLLPKMKETGMNKDISCRIVNVSSDANYGGHLNFNSLEKCKIYSSTKAYADSKLAQVMHAKLLNKMLQDEDVKVNVYSLHPAVAYSNLWSNLGSCINWVGEQSTNLLLRTTEDGANVVIYTALSPTLEKNGGVYLNNCQIVKPNSQADDYPLQLALWQKSIELTT